MRPKARCRLLTVALASLALAAGCHSDPYAWGANEETVTLPEVSAELTYRYPKILTGGRYRPVIDFELTKSDGPVLVRVIVEWVSFGRYSLMRDPTFDDVVLEPGKKARAETDFAFDVHAVDADPHGTMQIWMHFYDYSDPEVRRGDSGGHRLGDRAELGTVCGDELGRACQMLWIQLEEEPFSPPPS